MHRYVATNCMVVGGGAGRNVDAAAEQRQPADEDQRQLK